MRVAKVRNHEKDKLVQVTGTDYEIIPRNLKLIKLDPDLERRCFKVYPDTSDFEKEILNKRNIWVIYKFSFTYSPEKQQRYEDIVCGFLQYYDLETRNGMISHTIYFYWGEWGTDKHCVVIFIDEPPIIKEKIEDEFYEGIEEIARPPAVALSFKSDPPKPPPPPPPY